jgi:hypothetical protein
MLYIYTSKALVFSCPCLTKTTKMPKKIARGGQQKIFSANTHTHRQTDRQTDTHTHTHTHTQTRPRTRMCDWRSVLSIHTVQQDVSPRRQNTDLHKTHTSCSDRSSALHAQSYKTWVSKIPLITFCSPRSYDFNLFKVFLLAGNHCSSVNLHRLINYPIF